MTGILEISLLNMLQSVVLRYHLAVMAKRHGICFNNDKPDICVLDVMMPEMDGFTLAEEDKGS